MQFNGLQQIPAAPATVWAALNDPVVLKACLPGCESVEQTEPERFEVVLTSSIGPLRARFRGRLMLADVVAPTSCVMIFEGQGGAIGFGQGRAEVALRAAEVGCELTYVAQAQVGGKLAQIGARLIDSVAKRMSDAFFEAFRRHLEGAGEPGRAS